MAKRGGLKLDVDVTGYKEALDYMENVRKGLDNPFADAMQRATILIAADARTKAPVDEGRLKNSILPSIRVEGDTVIGVVGSNVLYAPYMELGTQHRRMPPVDVIERWARRKGYGAGLGFIIARRIWISGGLKAREFLGEAFDENLNRVIDLLGDKIEKVILKS